MPINREQFKIGAASLPAFVDIHCQELGGDVRIARLTTQGAVEAARYVSSLAGGEDDIVDAEKLDKAKADMVARSIVGEDGQRILDDQEGREMLAGLPVGVLSRLYSAAERLNCLSSAVDTAKKN